MKAIPRFLRFLFGRKRLVAVSTLPSELATGLDLHRDVRFNGHDCADRPQRSVGKCTVSLDPDRWPLYSRLPITPDQLNRVEQ